MTISYVSYGSYRTHMTIKVVSYHHIDLNHAYTNTMTVYYVLILICGVVSNCSLTIICDWFSKYTCVYS